LAFKNCQAIALVAFCVLLYGCAAHGQTQNAPRSEVAGIPVNYDESRVGTYTLPNPLTLADGKPVRDAKSWTQKRRPEIVRLFEYESHDRNIRCSLQQWRSERVSGEPKVHSKAAHRRR